MRMRGVSQNVQPRPPAWANNSPTYLYERPQAPGEIAVQITRSSVQPGAHNFNGDRFAYGPLGSVPRGSPLRPGAHGSHALRPKQPGTAPPLAPRARTVTMRDMEDAVDRLRSENEALKVEVHRLRKIEAGWFPPREGNSTNVNVYNNYEQRISQYVEEVNALRQELMALQAENGHLYEQLQRVDEGLANDLRARLAQAQFENSSMVAEMQRLNQIVESERGIVVDLRDQLERLRAERAREIQDAEDLATRELKATITELRLENRRLFEDADAKGKLILSLEARLAGFASHAGGDSGTKDRDRIIEHYKLKWDEIRKDNARLRHLLLQKEEEIQAVILRAAADPSGGPRREQDRALVEAFKAEIDQLKNEIEFYKRRSRAAAPDVDLLQEDVYEEVNVHREGGREHRTTNFSCAGRAHTMHEIRRPSPRPADRRSRVKTTPEMVSPSGDEAQSAGFSPPSPSPFGSDAQMAM